MNDRLCDDNRRMIESEFHCRKRDICKLKRVDQHYLRFSTKIFSEFLRKCAMMIVVSVESEL